MSEQKENQAKKASENNKLGKYGATKKTMYSVLGMAACILLIVVLSITQAVFEPDMLMKVEFWIDFAILSGLSIYGMISGQQTGDDLSRNNPSGAFRVALASFKAMFTKIDNLKLFAFFEDWIDLYRTKKLKKKIEATLRDNGIHQLDVLRLDIKEVDNLVNPFKKTWPESGKVTYFLSYTPEQIDIIKFCMTGGVKVSKLPSSFFLSALNQSEKDMWESAANSDRKKSVFVTVNYLYRILGLLAIAIISAGLIPGKSEDINQATVWLSLAKRIFCVIAAFCWGVFIGHEIVKIDITYIEFKTDVLNQYLQENELGLYKPESIEEKAKKDYEMFSKSKGSDLNGGTTNNENEGAEEQGEQNILD